MKKIIKNFPFLQYFFSLFCYCSDLTIIDHIYTNHFLNNDMYSGIVTADISDQVPVFLISNDLKFKLHKIRSFLMFSWSKVMKD